MLALQVRDQLNAFGVVDAHHRATQSDPIKEPQLGLPVGVHVTVVVQVILGEVGEHGQADLGAIEPAFHQSDRRRLDHARAHASLDEIAQSPLQEHRIGRGQTGAHPLEPCRARGGHQDLTQAQGADHGTALAQAGQGLGQPPGTRGFAVGAGQGQHLHLTARVVVVFGGDGPTSPFELVVGRTGLVHGGGRTLQKSLSLDQTRRRAALQRGVNVAPTIVSRTRPGQKSIARRHLAAVGVQATHTALAQPLGRLLGRVEVLHQNDSGSALATTCGLTVMSGGTPIMRKVC